MKNNILKLLTVFLFFVIIFITYFSTIGIETDRFNNQIKNKVVQINKNLDLDLKKIKFTLDPLNLKIYAKTVGSTIFYAKKPLALEYIRTQVSLSSLIKEKIISSNFQVATKSLLFKDLIKFIRATNSKTELIILEKIVKKGHIILDLNFNIDDNGAIKNDYEIKGLIKDVNINLLNQAKFKNINFNFNLTKDQYLLNNIKFKLEEINFISKKLNIKKKKNFFSIEGNLKNNESALNLKILKLLNLNSDNINIEEVTFKTDNKFSFDVGQKYKVKNITINSNINFNQLRYKKLDIIKKYIEDVDDLILLNNHQLNLIYKNKNLSIKGKGEIQLFDNQVDQIKYLINKKDKDFNINSEIFLERIFFKEQEFLKNFFPQINKKINFSNQKLKINYNNNNLSLSGYGKFKIDKEFEDIEYFFNKKENSISFKTNLNIINTKFHIDNINYKKKDKSKMNLKIEGEQKNNSLNIYSFALNEEDNKIKLTNLSLNESNQIIKIDRALLDYLDTEKNKNSYVFKKVKNYNYILNGTSFNANSLITNLLERNNEKEISIFENNLNLELNLKKVFIDKTNFVKDLKGFLKINNNKVVNGDIMALLHNTQNIKFTIRTNKQDEKITTLFSSKAKPLVNRYKFIKGFEDGKNGYLDFYSIKKDGLSTSKLVIDNFKVKEIPALAKLLSLASLQGIADLLTGEGIRFTNFEMNFTNKNKLMRIQELYAIGPAISILLEGYIEEGQIISLRGTLVPATTINKYIASLPIIGDLLIGKKVGEGVFGVSFKVKGPPSDLETSVNPIKTLAPRFITRTLEKIKKN
tara:strand:+ start:255 stop:2681 length:2427 start_codon:yes stop_codon:yes gene_type:complete